jgi:hypothetical protein
VDVSTVTIAIQSVFDTRGKNVGLHIGRSTVKFLLCGELHFTTEAAL